MSISIKKNLYIDSLDYFYKLIKSNEELFDNNQQIAAFHDYMYDYYNGCPCNSDSSLNLANKEFDSISNSEECILMIKEHFKCDDVIFNK
jgi:hypothetical protein